MKLDLYVKCFRCRLLTDAGRGPEGQPAAPHGWSERKVIPGWALGALPVEVLLCRACAEVVDGLMGEAWGRALLPPPEPKP